MDRRHPPDWHLKRTSNNLRVLHLGKTRPVLLAEAEVEILNVLWALIQPTMSEILASYPRPLSLNTVATTTNRLVKKGLVVRRRVGRSYRYGAVHSREQMQEMLAAAFVAEASKQRLFSAVAMIERLIEIESDIRTLSRLEQLVRKRLDSPSGNGIANLSVDGERVGIDGGALVPAIS